MPVPLRADERSITPQTRSTRSLVLIGAGGHALVVAEAGACAEWTIAGFLDDDPTAGLDPLGAPRLGPIDAAARLVRDHAPILALGDLPLRRGLIGHLENETVAWATIIHPSAQISPSATIGPGVFIGAGAIVNARARIGSHAIVNTGAIVEHDALIGANVHLAPRIALGGGVRIDDDTLIGIGAVIKPGIHIGLRCTIGAGAVVVGDIDDDQTAIGVPARVIGSAVL